MSVTVETLTLTEAAFAMIVAEHLNESDRKLLRRLEADKALIEERISEVKARLDKSLRLAEVAQGDISLYDIRGRRVHIGV